jgi:uncharacterized protein YkwD
MQAFFVSFLHSCIIRHMKHFLAAILLIGHSISFFAQTEKEMELLALINYCRTQPAQFAQEVVKPYLQENGLEKLTESRSLVRTLEKQKPLKPLSFANDLQQVATSHAVDMGTKGLTGHKGFGTRYKKGAARYAQVAENCSYGFDEPLDILMQLLIDAGIPDLGHRKNLLSPLYSFIGIHIAPHKREGWNCVMSFGG